MARRKKDYASDYSSDSDAEGSDDFDERRGENEDERAERELFEQRSGSKRRRLNKGDGKASAWEGIFGEDDEGSARFEKKGKRNSAFKAPTFVSKSTNETTVPEAELPIARPDDEDATAGSEASDDHDEIAERGPPRTRENSYSDDEPTAGAGIGLGASKGSGIGSMPTRGGFGGGIGSSRGRGSGGIGSARTGPSIGGGGIGAGIGSPASKPFGMSSFAKSSGTEAEQAKERQVSGETQGTSSRPEPYTRISNDNLGGIGTAKRHEIEEAEEEALYPSDPAHAMPQSFGSQRPSTPQPTKPNRAQKAFTVKNEATPSNKPKLSVTSRDLNHLTSISSSFGARMLAKQGWAPGKGLGKDEDGKAVPIEANVGLARGQGIGKGVRTEQSRREAKERGELEEGSSDEERKARKKKKERQKEAAPGKGPSAAWKRERKVKVKTQHKTYDELVAEAAENGIAASSGVGLVLDARSGELKEVSSLAELSLSARAQTEWTPTGDKMQLPELRHNLRLILDSTKGDVQALIKESQSVRMRREWAKREVQRLRVEDGTELKKTQRLREVHEIANQVATLVQQVNNSRGDPLESMKDQFNRLVDEYKDEYKEYDLDEVVIGAMSQTLAPKFKAWQPLSDSDNLLAILLRWKKAYRFSESDNMHENRRSVQLYNDLDLITDSGDGKPVKKGMSCYEAMLDKFWLPKVRSALNNDWVASDPQPAVRLVESWTPILPRFMRDNVINQLILPKITMQIGDWNPRRQRPDQQFSLASFVFPWLSTLQDHGDGILEAAKVRIGEMMKRWSVKEMIPEEWILWKDIFSKGKWDTLMLSNVVPKLAAHLDSDFEVDPRDQKMEALDCVLLWSSLLRESFMAQILETKFFPVWLDTLHFWLIQPNYKAGEVASWYHFWKDHLGEFKTAKGDKLTVNKGVDHGFRAGLKLMEDAMALGVNAPNKLHKPVFSPLSGQDAINKKSKHSKTAGTQPVQVATDQEVTFRSIAESYAGEHNLLFIPTGRSHAGTGKQLFKVAKSLDGRGVTVYVGQDAVYAQVQDDTFRAVLLDDMVKMAGI